MFSSLIKFSFEFFNFFNSSACSFTFFSDLENNFIKLSYLFSKENNSFFKKYNCVFESVEFIGFCITIFGIGRIGYGVGSIFFSDDIYLNI